MKTYVHSDACEMSQIDASFTCTCGAKPEAVPLAEQIKALREALEPFVQGYSHTEVFLRSRERMHPDGQALYRADVERGRAALEQGS